MLKAQQSDKLSSTVNKGVFVKVREFYFLFIQAHLEPFKTSKMECF